LVRVERIAPRDRSRTFSISVDFVSFYAIPIAYARSNKDI
jgi:hypothetical protein